MRILLRFVVPVIFLFSFSQAHCCTKHPPGYSPEPPHVALPVEEEAVESPPHVALAVKSDDETEGRLLRDEIEQEESELIQALERELGSKSEVIVNMRSFFKAKRRFGRQVYHELRRLSRQRFRHFCCIRSKQVGIFGFTASNIAATVKVIVDSCSFAPDSDEYNTLVMLSAAPLAVSWAVNLILYCPCSLSFFCTTGLCHGEDCCWPFKASTFQGDMSLLLKLREKEFLDTFVNFVKDLYLKGRKGVYSDAYYEAYQKHWKSKGDVKVLSKPDYLFYKKEFLESGRSDFYDHVQMLFLRSSFFKEAT